ncbi:MAG: galactose mutarotase [Gemmataceae bacterium]|nr:galactose mutarotase [Gemmataceae bacterium]
MKFLALCLVLLLVVPAVADEPNPKVVGKVDGQDVHEFTLSAGKITMKVLSYGGIVRELHVPDKAGKTADVVLGFDTVDEYVKSSPYFGCLTGRVANRIARGKFTLDGKTYTLATNNDPNHLHGGVKGFDKRVWACKQVKPNSLQLSYSSADGEEGYPGKLDVTVTYMLTPEGEWHINYEAKTDKATPVNLTQHAYFNLAGHAAGTILDHMLEIRADSYTECDATLIPTGELKSVSGTPFDFRAPTAIGKRIKETGLEPAGYDLNYALSRGPSLAPKCATVRDPKSGRAMEVYTTEPGVQLYTANHQTGQTIGKGKVAYPQYCGFCLECQHFPDAINQPKFASVVLKPGETYRQKTIYRFLAE